MPKRPFKEIQRDTATEEALRRIEEAWKNDARMLDLSGLELSTLPEQISQLWELNLSNNQQPSKRETDDYSAWGGARRRNERFSGDSMDH